MAIHLVLPWIALAVVLRYPRDLTLFGSSSPRVDREGYVPSLSFLWLFGLEYLGFSPAFGAFVGPWLQFLQPSLHIGGFLFVATVAVELRAMEIQFHIAPDPFASSIPPIWIRGGKGTGRNTRSLAGFRL